MLLEFVVLLLCMVCGCCVWFVLLDVTWCSTNAMFLSDLARSLIYGDKHTCCCCFWLIDQADVDNTMLSFVLVWSNDEYCCCFELVWNAKPCCYNPVDVLNLPWENPFDGAICCCLLLFWWTRWWWICQCWLFWNLPCPEFFSQFCWFDYWMLLCSRAVDLNDKLWWMLLFLKP